MDPIVYVIFMAVCGSSHIVIQEPKDIETPFKVEYEKNILVLEETMNNQLFYQSKAPVYLMNESGDVLRPFRKVPE
ncbi:hypothetical protein [Myroides pelagicus]|uniref:Uncharacterized protein n=1 Tax=Myroides pelagicus TaxID=270914 RepID=A0A7K1GNM7_9FLAO|nr:hypothetical protein [Myroides pelagicus]MEC4113147.1 hypothetical protein [Myroides pelagicus]MTH29804.1 hypothetical protein [Myroides pelagicus]